MADYTPIMAPDAEPFFSSICRHSERLRQYTVYIIFKFPK